MAFNRKSIETRHQQVGKLYLRRWYFFEKHFSYFKQTNDKRAMHLFKALKVLPSDEVALLAEKYYKSKDYCSYDKELGDYTSAKPFTHKELSLLLERDSDELASAYRVIERKVGAHIMDNW